MQIFVSINMAELNTITISKDKKMRKETVKMWKDLKKGEAAGKNCLDSGNGTKYEISVLFKWGQKSYSDELRFQFYWT